MNLAVLVTWNCKQEYWRSWLRHRATNRKVAGSIPDGVTAIFHWHNPSGRTMALESTQPLTEMCTRNISWGVKAAGAYGWQPYHLHVPIVWTSGSLNLLKPSGPVQAWNGIALLFIRDVFLSATAKGATQFSYVSHLSSAFCTKMFWQKHFLLCSLRRRDSGIPADTLSWRRKQNTL
jgi:hypothetical protein